MEDFCVKRFDFAVSNILLSPMNGLINCAVAHFNTKTVDNVASNSANLLSELLMVGDGLFEIPNNLINSDELQCMIEFISTT